MTGGGDQKEINSFCSAKPVDISAELRRRAYYRNPALALIDFSLGRITAKEYEPFANLTDGRSAFITWADEQGWSDRDWRVALMIFVLCPGLNPGRRSGGAD